MRSSRPFWHESDSTVMPNDPTIVHAGDARVRQAMIGCELRRWYDTVTNEPMPDEWLDLLEQTEAGRENEKTEQSTGSEQARVT